MSSDRNAHAGPGPVSSQYAAAAIVPLIKAPTLWLPRPVEMPSDVHPLPDDISAYVSYNAAHFNIHLTPAASGPTSYQFVYPFTLEPHVLASDPPVYERVRSQRRELAQLLEQRKQDEANRRKDTLRRIAPGYDPSASAFLMPTSSSSSMRAQVAATTTTGSSARLTIDTQHQQHDGISANGASVASAANSSSEAAPAPLAEDPEDAFRSLKI